MPWCVLEGLISDYCLSLGLEVQAVGQSRVPSGNLEICFFICPCPGICWEKVRKSGQNKKFNPKKTLIKPGMLKFTFQYYIHAIFLKDL